MNLVAGHWSFDPFLLVAAAVVALHARGLRRLNTHASPARRRRRLRQACLFYLGVLVLLIAVVSPVDYWSDSYFWMHTVQHLLLIFGAPVPIVAGRPWVPLERGLPAGRGWPRSAPLPATGGRRLSGEPPAPGHGAGWASRA